MKMVLDVDKSKALTLAQELEAKDGIHAVAFKYNTKDRRFRKQLNGL